MACNCRDSTGELLNSCLGVCKNSSMVVEEQKRAIDLEERISKSLSILSNDIRNLMMDHKEEVTEEWINGFRRGFELSREIYECEDCN